MRRVRWSRTQLTLVTAGSTCSHRYKGPGRDTPMNHNISCSSALMRQFFRSTFYLRALLPHPPPTPHTHTHTHHASLAFFAAP